MEISNKKINGLISIIIVNWNGKRWLKECLKTLSNQTFKNIEIILVDNASLDDSLRFVENNFLKVRIIKNNKNLGFSNGVNSGIKYSGGEYIILINSDTWVKKGFVRQLYEFYINNNYDVIAPTEKKYGKDINFNCNTTIDLLGNPAYYNPRYKQGNIFYLSGVCLFFRKDVYLETKGLDNDFFMYFEDVDWFWRLSLLGKRYAYAENIFVHHEGAGSTGKGIKYNMFLFRNKNALQTLLKNYSLITLILVLPLYFLQNLFEILFFILILKFDIAYSYIEGWLFNIKNLKKILKKRAWIQKRRVISDWEIIKKMYWGSAKFKMLINYQK